jgi:phosphate transport system substrate-binding protein
MNKWRFLRVVVVALWVALVGAACGPVTKPSPSTDTLAGHVLINGGGGALPPVLALTAEFTRRHPGVSFEGLADIGSDPGVTLVAGGTLDLGYISRELKPAEVGTVQTLSLGFTGTGILVNAANPLLGLNRDQVAAIYSGQVSDWSDIGGARGKVVLLLREPGALRSSFESYFFPRGAPTYPKTAIQLTTGDEVLRSTASLAQTIGMATIEAKALAEPQVRFLAIDGVAPTKGNLASGAYKVSRPLYLTYPSDPQRMSLATRAFLEFARSPDGQAILRG